MGGGHTVWKETVLGGGGGGKRYWVFFMCHEPGQRNSILNCSIVKMRETIIKMMSQNYNHVSLVKLNASKVL